MLYVVLNGNKLPIHKENQVLVCLGRLSLSYMTQQQIIEKVHGLKTKIDLLRLLNELKREDLGKDCHPFTLNQINFYCNPNNVPQKRYKEFTIPKKSGGVRRISAPRGSLKLILSYLNVRLKFDLLNDLIQHFFSQYLQLLLEFLRTIR